MLGRKHADPVAIHKDTRTGEELFNRYAANNLELGHLVDEIRDDTRITELGDGRHARQVFDDAYTVTLWSLIRADESPLRVVEFAGRDQFAGSLLNGR